VRSVNHTGVVWEWLTAGAIKKRAVKMAVKIAAEGLYIKCFLSYLDYLQKPEQAGS
jgi:hypothetical protein